MVMRPSDREIASQFNELHLPFPVLRLLTNHESQITDHVPLCPLFFFPIWQVPQSKIALATSAKEAE